MTLQREPTAEGIECPAVREVLDRVGDKWSILVVALLGCGARRFTELRRSIEGISQRMLTLTLRGLERDGLVSRAVRPTVPPRIEYELTDLGRTLFEPATALRSWAERHREIIQAARRRHYAVTTPPSHPPAPVSDLRPAASGAFAMHVEGVAKASDSAERA